MHISLQSLLGLSGRAGRTTLIMLTAALLVGATLHFVTLVLRDHGPSFGKIAFNGNGASIVLILDLIGIISAEVICARRRAWLAMVLLLIVWYAGRFVLFGSD
jgi:hypothetical protein